MSRIVCSAAMDGAARWTALAEQALARAVEEKGESHPVAFPDTAYSLPVIYALTGERMDTLADLRRILARARDMIPSRPSDQCWLPYLGAALDAGVAALFACEALEACRYLTGPDPVRDIWLGAASDVTLRERGVEFVDGTAPGFAAITGAAPDSATAVRIARELQEKNLYVFMAGGAGGTSFAEQLASEGVQLGWETRLVPFGPDVSGLIYALGFASRVALTFGGVKPGQATENLLYNKNRVFAFVLALGEVTPDKYALAAGAINYGFPVIADTDIPEILPTGVCTYEHVVANVPHDTMVERALEVRGCKVRVTKVDIPVAFGPAFEGERIRKADVHAEFGGNRTPAFEFLTSVGMDDIQDHAIEVVGPDIDDVEPGTALPLSIWVEVAGRKMQTDFEPILERRIHYFINGAEGVWHMGQRDIVWTRISRKAFDRGFRLRHYGEILHAKLLSDYPAIVDKVKVTLITDLAEVERRQALARVVYDERNRRLETLTDEAVDVFYSCLLCQSFAPDHVCVITPERLGLCGAYNWLDGKAAFEIDATGPNQPVAKGECLDAVKGVWTGVNEYTFSASHKTVSRVCAYSIMDSPMTSCGCFEVICAVAPELNGVICVPREFTGDTPAGMRFTTLAGNVGGGVQTPGFLGCGKVFLTSRKFLHAEGGHKRIVWMPRGLKEQLGDDLRRRFAEAGEPDLMDRIADETVSADPAEIRQFMERVGHPALAMPDMSEFERRVGEPDAPRTGQAAPDRPEAAPSAGEAPREEAPVAAGDIERIKEHLLNELRNDLKTSIAREVVSEIIDTLRVRFLGEAPVDLPRGPVLERPADRPAAEAEAPAVSAAVRIEAVRSVPVRREPGEQPIRTVVLGATREQGGTRGRSLTVGGARALPFQDFEAPAGCRPLVAMEVFDRVSEKYPAVLRGLYGDLLADPARMARECVERYGADLISVRLEGTHPEKGGLSPQAAVDTVGRVLEAVDVPLIVTGHNHYKSVNETFKEVAKAFAGERLLLNWAEQDNYRIVAGAALAYGHCVVAQSPIDVNIAKQLNILLGTMDVGPDRIVIDPMTGALGYGLEYTYSVMERIRLTALNGDTALAQPMIVSPGFECAKIKECKASEADFPAWGGLESRAALWELTTAVSLLHAGADILVLYHPEAAQRLRRTIDQLRDGAA